MILIDTSALVDCLTGRRRSAPALIRMVERGERVLLTTLVLYEWRRGQRQPDEIAAQEALFPSGSALPFGYEEAMASAELYRQVRRPRGREIDLAIAACAITQRAELWTLNSADFEDIPGLLLART